MSTRIKSERKRAKNKEMYTICGEGRRHVASMGEKGFCWENLDRDNFEEVDIDGRIKLKWTLQN